MNKVIAGITASSILGLSLLSAVPANATEGTDAPACTIVEVTPAIPGTPAVPAVPPTEEVFHFEKGDLISPAVEAVPSQWWNFSPNKDQGPFDGPPSFPSDPRGTWQGPHTNGGPDKDVTGTFNSSNSDNGRASWFHRTPGVDGKDAVYGPPVKVIDVPASPGTPAIPAVPDVPAVTKEVCEEPEVPVGPGPKPDDLLTDPKHEITYQCDAVVPTRTDYITYTRTTHVFDTVAGKWVPGESQVISGVYAFPLDEEALLANCPQVPGDKPVDPPVTPEVPATPVVPETPVVVTPVAPVVPAAPVPTCADLGVTNIAAGTSNYFDQNDSDKDGVACEEVSTSPKSDVPVAGATPVQPEQTGQLANTGFNKEAAITGTSVLGLGILAVIGNAILRRRTA